MENINVPTYETCSKMQENGFNLFTRYYYGRDARTFKPILKETMTNSVNRKALPFAPTSQELSELLGIESNNAEYLANIWLNRVTNI
jgi:hypothetical protein